MGKRSHDALRARDLGLRSLRAEYVPQRPLPRPTRPRDFHLRGQVELAAVCLCPDTRRTHGEGRCPNRPHVR